MTREEQKLARELKKPLAKTCREVGKKRGWKTIAGSQYQVREGMLYVLMAIQAALDRGDRGSFSRENGRRSIMEDARDWCAARL